MATLVSNYVIHAGGQLQLNARYDPTFGTTYCGRLQAFLYYAAQSGDNVWLKWQLSIDQYNIHTLQHVLSIADSQWTPATQGTQMAFGGAWKPYDDFNVKCSYGYRIFAYAAVIDASSQANGGGTHTTHFNHMLGLATQTGWCI